MSQSAHRVSLSSQAATSSIAHGGISGAVPVGPIDAPLEGGQMDRRDDACEEIVQAQRKTKAQARTEGMGTPEPGLEPPARSYSDETGVADLGVNEPVVSADLGGTDEPESRSEPTGMFAGETVADRQAEEAVRQVLEEGFPDTRGHWKAGGQMPSGDDDSERHEAGMP